MHRPSIRPSNNIAGTLAIALAASLPGVFPSAPVGRYKQGISHPVTAHDHLHHVSRETLNLGPGGMRLETRKLAKAARKRRLALRARRGRACVG
jgi:hypothetical protein